MPVEGEPDNKKWVIYAADGKYKVGDFDGKKFTEQQNFRTYDNSERTFYASQTYNNIPEKDGRRIQIGWARITAPDMPFNHCMSFPAELKLKKSFDGYRLCPTPVREIKGLYKTNNIYSNIILSKEKPDFTASSTGDVMHVIAEFERGDAHDFGMNINGYEITYSNLFNDLNNINFPVAADKIFKMEAIIDKTIIEIYINDGELYFVKPFNSAAAEKQIKAFARGGEPVHKSILKKLEVHQLNSVWQQKGK